MIQSVTPQDTEAVLTLAEASGLFDADGIAEVRSRLAVYVRGNETLWFMAVDEKPVGVIYCSPEPMTEGTWNILMLLISPDAQKQGHGKSLVNHVESILTARGVRLVLVETSGTDSFAGARAFYSKCGYTEEARIQNFYTVGDDKVIFSKALA